MQELTWPMLKAIHDHFMQVAFKICADGRDVTPQVFAIRTNSRGRVVKMVAVPPELSAQFMSSDTAKDVFSNFLYQTMTAGSPLHEGFKEKLGGELSAVVHVSEAWMAPQPPSESEFVRPSQSPNREEVILITLHTSRGSIPVFHPIVDKPKRHAVQGKFPQEADMHSFTGRFAVQDSPEVMSARKH